MTLHETILQLIGYAEADQLDRYVLEELLGGRVSAAGKAGDTMVVTVAYPGLELSMRHKGGKVTVSLEGIPTMPFVANGLKGAVNVAEYPITGEAFTRVLKAALEAMEEGR